MSLNRYAKRRDANEADIIKTLRQLGCTVIQSDVVDLIVGYRGHSFIFEVKTEKGKLEPSQEKLLAEWRGQYDIIRNTTDALNIIYARVGL